MSQSRVARIVWAVAVGALAASVATYVFIANPTPEEWRAAFFFAGFGLIASALGYKTSNATNGNIGFLPFLSIAVVSPSIAAVATVLFSVLCAELLARRVFIKGVFNVSQFVLAEALAVWAYRAMGGKSILLPGSAGPSLIASVVTVAGWLMLNKLAVSTVVAASTGRDTKSHWIASMRMSAINDMLAFPLIYFFAEAYAKFGAGITSALALPMLGIRQLYKNNIALQKNNEELLQLMVATVEAQDPYTSGHSQRVSRYARSIARMHGLSAGKSERVATAALLHDVGKIYQEFFPILRKPGRLTDAEFEVMKTHSERGAALVAKVSNFEELVPLILHHHEAWDGSGYPKRISGDEIPLGARIIALADTIDAMSTSRPYRSALGPATVRAELLAESGRQFDPALCETILQADNWLLLVSELESATTQYPVVPKPMISPSRIDYATSQVRQPG